MNAGCYKFISCDPTDTIIRDLSSLKSGIAKYFMKSIAVNILEENEIIEFVDTFKKIVEIIMSHRKNFS